MPKQKTHRGSAKRFKRTGNGGLNVIALLQAICLLTNHKSKNVNYVKLQWFQLVITNAFVNNYHK